jgi:hypothetical protein
MPSPFRTNPNPTPTAEAAAVSKSDHVAEFVDEAGVSSTVSGRLPASYLTHLERLRSSAGGIERWAASRQRLEQ